MGKAFVIDVAKCSGCYNCQLACKDEHAENDWMPYAKPQPLTGQFWCREPSPRCVSTISPTCAITAGTRTA